MRLTPLDIRKQEFSRGLRGFDAEEVQAFLQMLSEQWEELLDENRRRDEKIRDLENKMAHYEKVEEALQEALQTARETARKARENAEERAALLLEQAESKAQEIKRDAEHERHQIKREAAKLSGRRSEIVTRLRAFLTSELELLARYEGDDPAGFIRLLPGEENRLQKLTDRPEGEARVRPEPSRRASPAEPREEFHGEEGRRGHAPRGAEREFEGWASSKFGQEPDPEAPEPERHVHDWTRSHQSEADVEGESAAYSGEHEEFTAFHSHEEEEIGRGPFEERGETGSHGGEPSAAHGASEGEEQAFADYRRSEEASSFGYRQHEPPGSRERAEMRGGEGDYPGSTGGAFHDEGEEESEGEAASYPSQDSFRREHDEGAPDEELTEGEDSTSGPGWSTETVVSHSSERSPGGGEDEGADDSEREDRTTTQASSEEIEKIRRILSDLE